MVVLMRMKMMDDDDVCVYARAGWHAHPQAGADREPCGGGHCRQATGVLMRVRLTLLRHPSCNRCGSQRLVVEATAVRRQ
eukprot:1136422-Pelagomonas_calceolata.AAC.3